MKQVLIKNGEAVVEEVPAPQVGIGEVLVQVEYSCISVGTEMAGVLSSADSLWLRALKSPDKVSKVLKNAMTQGLKSTAYKLQSHLDSGYAIGYSAAGKVLAVGEGIDRHANAPRVGQLVACAGAGKAYHAEMVTVPVNLTVPVPPGLNARAASTITLGAIALQGVRRSQPTLAETFVVVGLGVLGQLTAQLLRANGCRVIGMDLNHGRIQKALENGMDIGLSPQEHPAAEAILRLTDGIGADGVLVTAATADKGLLSAACELCRSKGRLVLVGDVPIHFNRAALYNKEIDFFISTSYGPGRYDRSYEEEGLDYPIGYVRWTERRNMQTYLKLLASNQVRVQSLIESVYPITQAGKAYSSLQTPSEQKPLIVLLGYPDSPSSPSAQDAKSDKAAVSNNQQEEPPAATVQNPLAAPLKSGVVQLGLVGAGGFAQFMHLPNLNSLKKQFALRAIMSRSGHNAKAIAKFERSAYATTSFKTLLQDKTIDALLICTRHHNHADYTLQALNVGKHVLVEKPLALSRQELEGIQAFYAPSDSHPVSSTKAKSTKDAKPAKPLLMTGFNRRFSPAIHVLRQQLENRRSPLVACYRMNAGWLPPDHWLHGKQGGGRNLGEACHIYDLFCFLTGQRAVSVKAESILPAEDNPSRRDENFSASIRFADGSLTTLIYTALGSGKWPKEHLEVSCEGKMWVLEDYKKLEAFGGKGQWSGRQDKGHRNELKAFATSILKGGAWPIPLWQQLEATRIALDVQEQLSA